MKKKVIKKVISQMNDNATYSMRHNTNLIPVHAHVFRHEKTVFYRETKDYILNYDEWLKLTGNFEMVFHSFNGEKGFVILMDKKTETLLSAEITSYDNETEEEKNDTLFAMYGIPRQKGPFKLNSIQTPAYAESICIASSTPVHELDLYKKLLENGTSYTELMNKITTVKNNVFIINKDRSGYILDNYEIGASESYNNIIETNYNDSFKPAYDKMISFLEDEDPGFVLFTGEPGTGKSSLIQHLIYKADNLRKKFVILPPGLISILSDPDFTSFAVEYLRDAILCLEDAEDILIDRKSGFNPYVNNILNITDGILGKIMKVKVLCTVNNETIIDKALLRKGRLKLRYNFEPLHPQKATALSAGLGINKIYNRPVTLADIYNDEQVVEFETTEKRIGFIRN
jgi:hypothetical protein